MADRLAGSTHGEGTVSRGIVTVFGSSRVRPSDREYQEAWRLGRLLAEQGWTVCNGGHDGTMEATARGAKEAGGATVGVTIGMYEPAQPNHWLDREIPTQSLLQRLEVLTTMGDAFVVLRGGVGTLLELLLIWNLAGSGPQKGRLILVVGPELGVVVETLQANLPMRTDEIDRLCLVDSVDSAVEQLHRRVSARSLPPSAG